MNFKILAEKENPLLHRKEINGIIESESTPKIAQILEFLEKQFSISTESVAVRKVKGKFGSSKFMFYANIYNSPELKNKIEQKPKIKQEK